MIDTCVYGHQQGKTAVLLPHQPEGMLQQFFRQVLPPVGRICSYAHNIGDPLLLPPQQNAVRIQVQHVLQVSVLFGKAPKDQVMLQTVFFLFCNRPMEQPSEKFCGFLYYCHNYFISRLYFFTINAGWRASLAFRRPSAPMSSSRLMYFISGHTYLAHSVWMAAYNPRIS